MTEPYVAELVQPKMALKTPQPEPPLVLGLQHCEMLEKGQTDHEGRYRTLTLTCQTLLVIS